MLRLLSGTPGLPVGFLFLLYSVLCTVESLYFSVGVKSQILSSVAPPRKKKLVTIFSQDMSRGLRNPCFTKFSVVIFL